MLSIQDDSLPELYSLTMKNCEASLLTKQEFFVKVAGESASFLPAPSTDVEHWFWEKCAGFQLPYVERKVLADMAPLLDVKQEVSNFNNAFAVQELMVSSAKVLHIAEHLCSMKDLPPLQLVKDLQDLGQCFMKAASEFASVKAFLPECESDKIKGFLVDNAANGFLKACEPLFASAKDASKHMPMGYPALIEARNVEQIKALLFTKKVFEKVSSHIDYLVQFTATLACVIKEAGQFFQSAGLAKIKVHESTMRDLQVYAATVHGLNLIFTKMGGKNGMGRAALVRESFV